MPRELAYLSLGSNLGDRALFLRLAVDRLQLHPGTSVTALSSLYETAPRDVLTQPWFLNRVIAVSTELSPRHLLALLQSLEHSAGRTRSHETLRGPRTLDLDILLYGNLVSDDPGLTIPHPRLLERRFVLEPLLEIAPDLIHPQTGRPFAEALAHVHDQDLRRL